MFRQINANHAIITKCDKVYHFYRSLFTKNLYVVKVGDKRIECSTKEARQLAEVLCNG